VKDAREVPLNHMRVVRKSFNRDFTGVMKARRGDVLGRKKARLERLITKAQEQLEALSQ